MTKRIEGNLKGLAPSELRSVERLFQRRLGKDEIVSLDFARELFDTASQLRRRIGVLVSREGYVEHVALGTKDILYLPDLGRYRLGRGRLRRLRLLFSDLSEGEAPALIPTDIFTDLEKLRLDMVVSLKPQKNRMTMTYGVNQPSRADHRTAVHVEHAQDVATYDFPFGQYIAELEQEILLSFEDAALEGRPRTVLVGVYPKGDPHAEESLAELKELARSAGVEVVESVIQRRDLDPRTLIGKGKLEQVVLECLRVGADIVIFDTELRPTQWRALTNATELKVLDRSMLILDIFAQRATSNDGRLQVELAQLKYNLPRLVETDSGLSRLSGGIGGRGPGETKLELGRRRARDKIAELEKRISVLGRQRELRRARRREFGLAQISIIGYTNVGKSTLFNQLTRSSVKTANKLFATLDPARRKLVFPCSMLDALGRVPLQPGVKDTFGLHHAVLSDTVGFIRQLPEELRNAFRATLEELYEAQLLLHVLDASDPLIGERKGAVDHVLAEMGLQDVPQIIVLNKIDAAPSNRVEALVREYYGVAISALEKVGFERLMEKIERMLFHSRTTPNLTETAAADISS